LGGNECRRADWFRPEPESRAGERGAAAPEGTATECEEMRYRRRMGADGFELRVLWREEKTKDRDARLKSDASSPARVSPGALIEAGVRISMEGRGRWMDNVFIERLRRALKYEDVYLKGYADGREAKAGISDWITLYNERRLHQALGYSAPTPVGRDGDAHRETLAA
jgi:hypothetical protein